MSALANEDVGHYLNKYFVCSFQKVGTFTVTDNGQKQGGNVATYICLPDSRVIHAIPGKQNAGTFLREVRWAVETREKALLDAKDDPRGYRDAFAKAHAERLSQYGSPGHHHGQRNKWHHGNNIAQWSTIMADTPAEFADEAARMGTWGVNNQDRAHMLLARFPNAKLKDLYVVVFERILGEEISTRPVVGS